MSQSKSEMDAMFLDCDLSDLDMLGVRKHNQAYNEAMEVVGIKPSGVEVRNKYQREIRQGVYVDVYDVLKAFNVMNPATQHAIKKLLAGGLRGHKDLLQDLNEAHTSISRAIELEL